MKRLFCIHIVFFMAIPLFAQQTDSLAVDSLDAETELMMQDTLASAPADSVVKKEKEEKPTFAVVPWEKFTPPEAFRVTNDSLMRWQIWPNWGDFQAYRRDVISFRQGSSGRIDAFHINGFEPLEQQIQMDGISLNNPITGLPNYNLVPHRKIGSVLERYGGMYESEIRIRDYYITKPISYLNYDEASGNYRNLEFLVSQNFTDRTNFEVSYWDRRDGGYYPNSEMQGSQITGRVYHHLSPHFLVRGLYLRNQITKDEPFGYNVIDPLAFPFDEFASAPLSTNGNSEFTRWDLLGGIYHRKDTASAEDAGFEASITKNKKELFFSRDTLSWDIRSLNGKLFKQLEWRKFQVGGEVKASHHAAEDHSIISTKNWLEIRSKASLRYQVTKNIHAFSSASLENRNDDKSGFDITGGISAKLFRQIEFTGSVSSFSHIPTMQAMYWQSKHFRGNPDLKNETGISTSGKLDFQLTKTIKFGISGRFKASENATFITADSSFTNHQSLEHVTGTLFGKFENYLFEIESSGTFQQFNYGNSDSFHANLNFQEQILWLRNAAFIKGYVFDRAAYLKIGVKTLLSPFYYNARTYNTELAYWQGNSIYQEIPPFFRLDGELSARVRGIMVVIRWENALDGIGQAGYFEAAGYPMPPRRLIVGIRAQFRN